MMVGLGIGLGAGVFIGTLLAPKSGRETRQLIRNSAAEGEEHLEQRVAELRDTLKDLIKAVSRQQDVGTKSENRLFFSVTGAK